MCCVPPLESHHLCVYHYEKNASRTIGSNNTLQPSFPRVTRLIIIGHWFANIQNSGAFHLIRRLNARFTVAQRAEDRLPPMSEHIRSRCVSEMHGGILSTSRCSTILKSMTSVGIGWKRHNDTHYLPAGHLKSGRIASRAASIFVDVLQLGSIKRFSLGFCDVMIPVIKRLVLKFGSNCKYSK